MRRYEPLVIAGVEQEVAEGTGAIRAYEALMFGAERHDAAVQVAWRRITVGEVLGYLASGMSEAELREEFPQLAHEDILACFAFAAERERRLQAIPAA